VNAKQPWGLRALVAESGVIFKDGLPRDGPVLILVPLRLGKISIINYYCYDYYLFFNRAG
jgi:hypothetical protein